MDRRFFLIACFFGFTGVALGAFGAHALADRVTVARLETFQTGIRYQLIHAIALFVVAWAGENWPGAASRLAGILFTAGIAIFSGSLYLLVLLDKGMLGAITPLGGLCLLGGWIALALTARRRS